MKKSFKETYNDVVVAPTSRRIIAFVYDLLLITALLMVATGIITLGFNNGEAVAKSWLPWFQSFLFVVVYVYLSYFWVVNGQTLGMQAWRLRVQTTEGERLSYKQSLIRYVVGILSLVCLGIGFLWMFIHPQKMTWHDIASGTHVVLLPKRAPVLK